MEPGGPEGGREGAEAKGRVCWRAGEPQRGARPGIQVAAVAWGQPRPCQSRPPGPSRAATPQASRPASQGSSCPGTRLRALREGWWR